ncbi:GNAT family N-acetyltransferase [Streptomyces sp. NPDC059224]|uniref:GNAT family N-acetyltransferase n=1 Tax=Streptomyces sp. NPDC059224 TaxID=3346775 RepID=UPI003675EC20
MTVGPAPERFARISAVPQWPAEERSNVFLTRGWTSSVEGALTDRQVYLLGRDTAGEVGATAAVYAIGPDTHSFFNPSGLATQHLRDESLLAHLTAEERAGAAKLAGRLETVLSTSAVNTAPFGFTHGVSGTGGESSLRPLVRELDVLRREWDTGCSAVLYVEEHDRDLRAVLTREGYTSFHVGANCVLPVAWDSFDGYLATLSRRRGVLKERRHFQESGFTVAVEPVEDNLEEIAHLQALLQEKYGRPYDRDGERAVFVSVIENIGEYAHLLVARKDAELLAFAMFFEKDGIIHVKMAARDVERVDPESFAHFNVGYYEMVEEAVRRGAREINYGPEGYATKLRRGCTARNLYWYVKVPEPAREDLSEAARLVSLMHARLLRSLAD